MAARKLSAEEVREIAAAVAECIDIEGIADAIIRKTKPLRARALPPREPPTLSPEERATVRDITMRKLARVTRKR